MAPSKDKNVDSSKAGSSKGEKGKSKSTNAGASEGEIETEFKTPGGIGVFYCEAETLQETLMWENGGLRKNDSTTTIKVAAKDKLDKKLTEMGVSCTDLNCKFVVFVTRDDKGRMIFV